MTLASSSRLGSFEVVSRLGAGGMGEVYRARDTRLDRQVAIKILRDEVSSDPERLARFEREAKVLAALNHPGIAAIYSFESAVPEPVSGSSSGERLHFLVMELAAGRDLAEHLTSGPLAIERVLDIAAQLVEALDAAHGSGVVHRDLKPANLMLDDDGRLKVLDFGLAKALDSDSPAAEDVPSLSVSPTLTQQMTGAGVILGTAAYMSPEAGAGSPDRPPMRRLGLRMRGVRDARGPPALLRRDRRRRPGRGAGAVGGLRRTSRGHSDCL